MRAPPTCTSRSVSPGLSLSPRWRRTPVTSSSARASMSTAAGERGDRSRSHEGRAPTTGGAAIDQAATADAARRQTQGGRLGCTQGRLQWARPPPPKKNRWPRTLHADRLRRLEAVVVHDGHRPHALLFGPGRLGRRRLQRSQLEHDGLALALLRCRRAFAVRGSVCESVHVCVCVKERVCVCTCACVCSVCVYVRAHACA